MTITKQHKTVCPLLFRCESPPSPVSNVQHHHPQNHCENLKHFGWRSEVEDRTAGGHHLLQSDWLIRGASLRREDAENHLFRR